MACSVNSPTLTAHRTAQAVQASRRAVLGDLPDWSPIRRALPAGWVGGFMWTGALPIPESKRIDVYRHGITRTSLSLGPGGLPAVRTPQAPEDRPSLLQYLGTWLAELAALGQSPYTAYDSDHKLRTCRALIALGYTVIM